jgi:hypothetical protein
MELSTEVPIDADAIQTICCLRDDLYRLRWVRYAYHDISQRLVGQPGRGLGENASWPTFAQWSAYTISEALRLDKVNPRLEEVLREHALPPKVTGPLVEMQKRMRRLDDGAMPTVLALGNRLVFHEVGWTLLHFVSWIESQSAYGTAPASSRSTRPTSFGRLIPSGYATESALTTTRGGRTTRPARRNSS